MHSEHTDDASRDHDHGPYHSNKEPDHEHSHGRGPLEWPREAIPFLHGHSHAEVNVDAARETSERGIWALKVSLVGLGATALFQVFIVFISGSVALLADIIHNFSDALTAVPLCIAFVLGRRAASRRYTYGYGRAEDIAGVVIVLMIFYSALVAGYERYNRLINPQPHDITTRAFCFCPAAKSWPQAVRHPGVARPAWRIQ